MINRTAIFLIILLLAIPACSKEAGEKSSEFGDALIKPDNGYIILLGRGLHSDLPHGFRNFKSMVLIAGGTVRDFEALRNPVVSSNGHVAGINESGETVVYYTDEESAFRFVAVEGEDKYSINGGIGISNSGKRIYQVGIEPVEEDGEKHYAVQLVEFDTDHRRITNKITLHEYSDERFYKDHTGIIGSLRQPLLASQNGELVYITSVELDDEKRGGVELPTGLNPYESRPSQGEGVNCYVYDRGKNDFKLRLGFSEYGYKMMHLEDISYDGRISVFITSKLKGPCSVTVVRSLEREPQNIGSSGMSDMGSSRISHNGSKIGYFTRETEFGDVYDPLWRAVMVSTISKREDLLFELSTAWHALWSNDIKYVAYVSNSFKSSIVKEGKKLEYQPPTKWYLHLINVETLEDTVVYVSYGKDLLTIIDIVAESDEFKDKTKSKPRFPPQEEGKGGGAGDGFGKGKKKYGTGEGPSISAK